MDFINGFGRTSPGFGSDSPTGSGWARGSLHFSGIRASRIQFGPANQVGPKKGCYILPLNGLYYPPLNNIVDIEFDAPYDRIEQDCFVPCDSR